MSFLPKTLTYQTGTPRTYFMPSLSFSRLPSIFSGEDVRVGSTDSVDLLNCNGIAVQPKLTAQHGESDNIKSFSNTSSGISCPSNIETTCYSIFLVRSSDKKWALST